MASTCCVPRLTSTRIPVTLSKVARYGTGTRGGIAAVSQSTQAELAHSPLMRVGPFRLISTMALGMSGGSPLTLPRSVATCSRPASSACTRGSASATSVALTVSAEERTGGGSGGGVDAAMAVGCGVDSSFHGSQPRSVTAPTSRDATRMPVTNVPTAASRRMHDCGDGAAPCLTSERYAVGLLSTDHLGNGAFE